MKMMDLMMYMPGMMDSPTGDWGGFWWPFMLIPLLLWGVFLSLLVWFVVRVLSKGRGAARPGATTDSAEEILRERFARGDVSAEEYEKSMKVMRATQPRKGYEDYVREAEERLRSERDTES
jgi:putative membrane protein